ncbi:SipW-dependent biofilm matrix protein BsaA [Clostridium perfringens]|uniref:SipW-dependent biofilm matrix protein BsaA n=1 Tax=Clostridium perfringens TaxID=1502 RepID=UPI001CB40DA7|nr:SipW-dependent biofilm matrix protein BsaA [Clostridium perfringens]MDM1012184.1 SipW-dependent biofilm matrix protein BsaA [Clostridium perfringens]MDU7107648.1 SipW-dependent biofilm matrix protein BsaA [Clostridium perfringens]MEA5271293.1 SipW-dependent biofilm matrix protein BsaA [Clostridium perfringens]MEA5311192.1 SipW-dependent biofilm matrix protein BsaA [Clostridium perfringens]MEA5341491.1 SipW-dependent biofilm matrix protein BsaA [Clostridium perfringens]
MSKKKIIGLCIAGVLAVGSIGGSLAWFTSSDSITNPFSTASTDNPSNPNSGIKINEKFNKEEADNTLPGDKVTKQVNVSNTATYDQLIRVKIEKVWKDAEGTEKPDLDKENIILNFEKNLTDSNNPEEGKWIKGSDGYYYYNGIVNPKGQTSNLLESVTLSKDTTNEFKGLKFDVTVNSEGVQAANGAVSDSWKDAPQAIKDLGAGTNAHK